MPYFDHIYVQYIIILYVYKHVSVLTTEIGIHTNNACKMVLMKEIVTLFLLFFLSSTN